MLLTRFQSIALSGGVLMVGACAPLPRQAFATVRLAEYANLRRETAAEVASAMQSGHLVLGMDRDQVYTVLGIPVRKVSYSSGETEVWLYRGGRLHQDQPHTHGNEAFRVVFIKGRLALIETI